MFIISKKLTVQKTVFVYHVRDKKIRRIVAVINEVIERFFKRALKVGISYRIFKLWELAYLCNVSNILQYHCKQNEYGENLKLNISSKNAKHTDQLEQKIYKALF